MLSLQSVLGVVALIGFAWAISEKRSAVSWPRVGIGLIASIALAALFLKVPPVTAAFGSVNGAVDARVPNTTNISFDRVEAESLLIALDLEGIAVSTGSACSSGTLEPSHVLRAMGLPTHRTQNSLRFSLGMFSTEEEVDRVVDVLPRLVEKLRGLTRKTVTA